MALISYQACTCLLRFLPRLSFHPSSSRRTSSTVDHSQYEARNNQWLRRKSIPDLLGLYVFTTSILDLAKVFYYILHRVARRVIASLIGIAPTNQIPHIGRFWRLSLLVSLRSRGGYLVMTLRAQSSRLKSEPKPK